MLLPAAASAVTGHSVLTSRALQCHDMADAPPYTEIKAGLSVQKHIPFDATCQPEHLLPSQKV